jgi:protein gp37
MGETTAISWTHHTWNPWLGCTKVSPGCQHCYAEVLMDKRYHRAQWGPQGTRIRTSDANWQEPLKWNRKAAKDGVRRKVFCASLADMFEGKAETLPWLWALGQLIEQCRNLDWLLLTKRPENVVPLIERYLAGRIADLWLADNPHVWIGTTVENQEMADKRIPILLTIPARIRFLSCEPLLGPIDLKQSGALWTSALDNSIVHTTTSWQLINWVIVGGESGSGAREMKESDALALRDQCHAAGIDFFFKQWGAFGGDQSLHHGGDWLAGTQYHEVPTP